MRALTLFLVLLLFQISFPLTYHGTAYAEQELIVSAAASLTNAFGDIGKRFEKANPGTKIIFNFAASGPLLQQIEKGAPVDVFASADQKTMDQAADKKLILTETRKDFAGNKIVLISPKGSKVPITAMQDLAAKEVQRIGLGNPETVPAGRYAQEALKNDGLWESLQPKLITGESVRQVLDYVGRGEVDAGFVFATDAAIARDKVQVVLAAEKHKPVVYPIAVVESTRQRELAQHFIDYVLSKEGQEVLSQYGFGKP